MPNIQSVTFKQNSMILLINGIEHNFELDKVSSKLLNATSIQRNDYQISPANYGIHWPLIDEDLSIKKLLEKYKGHLFR